MEILNTPGTAENIYITAQVAARTEAPPADLSTVVSAKTEGRDRTNQPTLGLIYTKTEEGKNYRTREEKETLTNITTREEKQKY